MLLSACTVNRYRSSVSNGTWTLTESGVGATFGGASFQHTVNFAVPTPGPAETPAEVTPTPMLLGVSTSYGSQEAMGMLGVLNGLVSAAGAAYAAYLVH